MAYDLRDGQGSLFRSDRATTDRHPTHTGSCMIGGVEYRISAWTKEGKKGRFFSLAFEPKEDARFESAAPVRTEQPTIQDDDIPF